MVKLRMQRGGKTHRPFYKIVATHGTRKRDGDYIERIGSYDSIVTPPKVTIDEAKALKWLSQGAQPSDTVKSLLRKAGILHKWRLTAKGMAAEEIQAEMEKWRAKQGEKAAAKRVKKTKALKKKTETKAEVKTEPAAPAAE
ncbi:30S ribosomal protein S16 [bacterium]|nr:MAG: 30S ribosomal protein S16 [bacterium]